MSRRLTGKTAFITGAAQGIGRKIAVEFATSGAHVISMDMDESRNAETASVIRNAGGGCQTIRGDVSIAADVKNAFDTTDDIDILVNNAASWAGDGFLHEVAEDNWDRILSVSLKGVFLCCRAVLPRMMKRRRGVIINISSINALTGIHLVAYSAAKGAILSLTRVLAQQYGSYGIRTNAICPGTILTESARQFYEEHRSLENELRSLYPSSSFGSPTDVANCALFLASEDSGFINGSTLVVDGGVTAVHRLPSAVPSGIEQ